MDQELFVQTRPSGRVPAVRHVKDKHVSDLQSALYRCIASFNEVLDTSHLDKVCRKWIVGVRCINDCIASLVHSLFDSTVGSNSR